jgi:hypothetical protein
MEWLHVKLSLNDYCGQGIVFWLPGSAFLSAGPAGAWSSVCPLSGEFDGAVSGVVLTK